MKIHIHYLLLIIFSIVIPLNAQETNLKPLELSPLKLTPEETDEERIEFLLEVANAYIEEEDWPSAVTAYERIVEIDSTHEQANYILAHVCISAKQYKKAEELLLKLIEQHPEKFELYNNLAWLYATAEDPKFRDGKKAIELAHEAMTIAPNDHHVWSTLSEAYYICGEYEKAYRAIKHMALLAAKYGKGLTKKDVDDYNKQIEKCKRALDTWKALNGDTEEEDSVTP